MNYINIISSVILCLAIVGTVILVSLSGILIILVCIAGFFQELKTKKLVREKYGGYYIVRLSHHHTPYYIHSKNDGRMLSGGMTESEAWMNLRESLAQQNNSHDSISIQR